MHTYLNMRNLFLFFLLITSKYSIISCNRISNSNKISQPNILLIFTDDQRADALGIAPNPHIKTPNIDNLAKSGIVFQNSYVMGGHHGAICAPSRAMLLSGKSLFHVYDRLDGIETLPNYLNDRGYQTFATGKWHNGTPSFEANFEEGSNIMLGGMSDHFNVPVKNLDINRKLNNLNISGFSTDLFVDSALNYLDKYNKSEKYRPFFCYIALTAPHDPRSPAPNYSNIYKDDLIPVPSNFKPVHPFKFDNMNERDETLAPWPRTEKIIQSSIAEYYSLIQHIDDRVGDIIKRLKEYDLFDNTLIIYASDNGLALGSHGLLGKQNLYEHSTKVPLIISGPGIPKGQTSMALVYLFDLFPTVTEYLKLQRPNNIDGLSLMNIIQNKQKGVRNSLYTAYRNSVRAVRDKDWKLIYYPKINYTQLYNLNNDPHELNNLAKNSENQIKVDKMMKLLSYHRHATNDTINLKPLKIQSKEYDYKKLVQTLDQWQPKYIIDKYFPEGTKRE